MQFRVQCQRSCAPVIKVIEALCCAATVNTSSFTLLEGAVRTGKLHTSSYTARLRFALEPGAN